MGGPSSRARRCSPRAAYPFTVLRPAVVYGKGVKGNIAALATLAKTPMPLPFARLTNLRSLLALDNLASAVSLVLTAKAAENSTFLVADAEPISVADMVTAMREGLGRPPHLVNVPSGAIMRLMKSFGREADWERISGKLRDRRLQADGHRLAARHRDQGRHRQDDARRRTAPALSCR